MLIDTHAHLDYTDYDPDRAEVISRAAEAGVTEIISIGTRIESSTRAVELAENFPNIWATVGIHPCDVDDAPDDAIERLRVARAKHARRGDRRDRARLSSPAGGSRRAASEQEKAGRTFPRAARTCRRSSA
jgi:Tat protein secretion system quality control protein TatD with DNase activity